jgi:hypothetical protein
MIGPGLRSAAAGAWREQRQRTWQSQEKPEAPRTGPGVKKIGARDPIFSLVRGQKVGLRRRR